MADDPEVNILAFFKVVASSQISPHSETVPKETVPFSAAKIHKKSYIANSCQPQSLPRCLRVPKVLKKHSYVIKLYYIRVIKPNDF